MSALNPNFKTSSFDEAPRFTSDQKNQSFITEHTLLTEEVYFIELKDKVSSEAEVIPSVSIPKRKYRSKKSASYKSILKIKALREGKETEPPKERIGADLRTLINPFLNDHLKTIFYGSYDEKQEAYSDIVSSYSPKDVLKEIVNYENEDDYDERLCYASKILRRMTEKDSFKALESFFKKHIRKNQEKYWIIKNFTSTICGFEFSDNSLNKRRIDLFKLIYNSYSPESEEGYSKEKMQEVFKKEIQSSLEDANTPLKKTF